MEIAIKSVMSGKTYFSQELLVNLLKKKEETVKIALKPREQAILELLCKGHSSQEIANMLFVSNRTVEKTRSELMLKTGTNNSISLAIFAVKNGLVSI